jgi:hypothetical protein
MNKSLHNMSELINITQLLKSIKSINYYDWCQLWWREVADSGRMLRVPNYPSMMKILLCEFLPTFPSSSHVCIFCKSLNFYPPSHGRVISDSEWTGKSIAIRRHPLKQFLDQPLVKSTALQYSNNPQSKSNWRLTLLYTLTVLAVCDNYIQITVSK